MPKFIKISKTIAEISRFFLSRLRPSAILDLFAAFLDHPRSIFGVQYTKNLLSLSLSLSLSLLQAGNPSGERSATRVLRLLHVALHDVDPPFSLSTPTPLSLQYSPDTILLFSTLYMSKPSQPGLPYLVRDARYSEDATDVNIPFLPRHVQ